MHPNLHTDARNPTGDMNNFNGSRTVVEDRGIVALVEGRQGLHGSRTALNAQVRSETR